MKKTSQILFAGLLICLMSGNPRVYAQGNVLLGPRAGGAITTAENNTLIGDHAGANITLGSNNTFVGMYSGYNNIAGSNTFIGSWAGRENTEGFQNTFIGAQAGRANTTGSNNTFVGRFAGRFHETGRYNTFVGELAGSEGTDSWQNTFIGYRAGQHTIFGGANTFVGYSSGEDNTEGQENTFIGDAAGRSNTTGNVNTFGGRSAGENNTTGSLNTTWGFYAGRKNTTGYANTFIGSLAGENNEEGGHNTYIGHDADGWETNNHSTALGNDAYVHGSNSTAIGDNAYVHGAQRLVLGATEGYNNSDFGTLVGIGKVTPNYLLELGKDDAAKPGTNVWTITSDIRLKKDIVPFTEGLDIIDQIDPVRFRYNGKAEMPTDKEYVGIIAQEIQKIAPYMIGETVHEDTTGAKETYLDYNGNAMTYLLINSVKELKAQNEALQEEIRNLKEEVKQASTPSKSLILPASQAKLWQNYPNPSSGKTSIQYEVPLEAQQVSIRLSTTQGQVVNVWQITKKGRGQVTLNAKEFPAGPYLYQLIVGEEIIDSKWMILTQ